MKNKLTNLLGTGKKRALTITLASALVLTFGTTAAFAASGAFGNGSLMVRAQADGNSSYSTDEGQTWNDGLPEGATVSEENGRVTITSGNPSGAGEGQGVLTNNKNGVVTYSIDGGETWSETLPEGYEAPMVPDSTPSIQAEGIEEGSVLVRNEDGVISYSTDGGETWTEGLPEGMTITKGQGGEILSTVGNPPADSEGETLMVKDSNGTKSYSTDGGNTWSETVPEGLTQNKSGSVSYQAN